MVGLLWVGFCALSLMLAPDMVQESTGLGDWQWWEDLRSVIEQRSQDHGGTTGKLWLWQPQC